jgi:hypothetical protein
VRVRVLVLVLAAVAALAAPATAQTPPDPCASPDGVVSYPTTRVFFHEGTSKVGNLADRAGQPPAPFDTTAPTRSVQAGAGAGAVSNLGSTTALAPGAQNTARFAGRVDGCLDTVLVDMYAFLPTNRTGSSGSLEERAHNFAATLTIDGRAFELAGPIESTTTVGTTNPAGTTTYRIRYAITGVRRAMERANLPLAGAHTVGFAMTGWFANTDNAVYVWDTTEVPSGLVFNAPADPAIKTGRL